MLVHSLTQIHRSNPVGEAVSLSLRLSLSSCLSPSLPLSFISRGSPTTGMAARTPKKKKKKKRCVTQLLFCVASLQLPENKKLRKTTRNDFDGGGEERGKIESTPAFQLQPIITG